MKNKNFDKNFILISMGVAYKIYNNIDGNSQITSYIGKYLIIK